MSRQRAGVALALVVGAVLPCISLYGLIGFGHGGPLEGTSLESVACAVIPFGPFVGAIVAVYFVCMGRDREKDKQAEIGWKFWVLWVLASAVAWAVGWVVDSVAGGAGPFVDFAVLCGVITGGAALVWLLRGQRRERGGALHRWEHQLNAPRREK